MSGETGVVRGRFAAAAIACVALAGCSAFYADPSGYGNDEIVLVDDRDRSGDLPMAVRDRVGRVTGVLAVDEGRLVYRPADGDEVELWQPGSARHVFLVTQTSDRRELRAYWSGPGVFGQQGRVTSIDVETRTVGMVTLSDSDFVEVVERARGRAGRRRDDRGR